MTNFKTMQPPIYDPVAVQPMRDELTYVGFEELRTPEAVDSIMEQKNNETVLIVLNSVCGCAAGGARPGVTQALQHTVIPDMIATLFAGMDRDAVDHLRKKYLAAFTPTSPLMALMKNGEVLHILHRYNIEGRSPEDIAAELRQAFEKHCSKKGPSIAPDKYDKLVSAKACGSKIPKYGE